MDDVAKLLKKIDRLSCGEKIALILYINSDYRGDPNKFYQEYDKPKRRVGDLAIHDSIAKSKMIQMINEMIRLPKNFDRLLYGTYDRNTFVDTLRADNCL